MGTDNSTTTRVSPVFDRIRQSDQTGVAWLKRLLALPKGGTGQATQRDLSSMLVNHHWEGNPAEIQLASPISLLRWLAQNLTEPANDSIWSDLSETTVDRRRKLINRDQETIELALRKLSGVIPMGKWYVLERRSAPDVHLETLDSIVVVEGKQGDIQLLQLAVFRWNGTHCDWSSS